MSRDQLLEEGNKLIERAQALDNKEKAINLACQSRSKLIPKNATIRRSLLNARNLIAIDNNMVHTTTLTGKILTRRD
jgi:hypothetical protein